MGPHKNGIVLNVEQFIKDVEARPAIWNRNYHCNKYFLEQTWQELCKIHKLPANVLKAKWKGLRDNFRVEFKRIPRNPDGQLAMAPEYHQSKWNHFFALQFLINHMRQRGVKYDNISQNDETLNCDDEECVVEPDIHNVLETCIDDNQDDLETQITNCKRRHQELVNEMNSMGNLSMVNGHNLNLSTTIEKKPKLILDNNSGDETLDLSTTNKNSRNCNNLNGDSISILNNSQQQNNQQQNSNNMLDLLESRNSNNLMNSNSNGIGNINGITPFNIIRNDDDYYYLMSLHPYMQKLTPAKKLKVRTKIQKLILKELYKKTDLQN